MDSVNGPLPRARILVVDDTPALLDTVREYLESEGFQVVTCLQSRDALPLARGFEPDAIMLDIVMPEMSGWDVLALLGADPRLKRIPVIICTAFVAQALGRLEDLRGPEASRQIGLLPKPFDLDELIEVVQSVTGTELTSRAGVRE